MSEIQNIEKILVFHLDQGKYALESSCVERVIPMVEITPLPKSPEIVLGIVNFHGEIVPVFDVRKRFRLKVRKINPDDFLIVAHATKRKVALIVDSLDGVRTLQPGQTTKTDLSVPFSDYLSGVVKTEEGLILIHDLDLFLAMDEEKALQKSINTMVKSD